ncbi:MAG TPA: LysR family transcriptional regulator [Acetobacteraceae bacterium]|nr:LysR family transcriptional regulator [Acetobacteraceae bacterium]
MLRNVTLRQLRVLAAVGRTASVTRAAALLHVTPPAVTLQLQALEVEAGLPLVERGPGGMTLTRAGQEVAEAAARIEATLADCDALLAALSGAERGTVSAGVTSTAKYFAPRALAAFARAHPALELRLSVGNRAETIAGLRDHMLDLAVMGRPPGDLAVDATPIGPHPHVIVAEPSHPLATLRGIAPAELAEETFLVREPGSGTRSLMERFFAEHGLFPRIGMEIGSNETIKQAVMAGLGIAFLSAHTLDLEVESRRLVVLDVEGLPIIRHWYAVTMAERRLTPAAQLLRQFLAEEGARFLPGALRDLPPVARTT